MRTSLLVLAASLLGLGGCASPTSKLPPCHAYDGLEQPAEAVALLHTEGHPRLIDGRPYVDDRDHRPEGCDTWTNALLPGKHKILFVWQMGGHSILVQSTYGYASLGFRAEAGHRYRLHVDRKLWADTWHCRIEDETTGEVVAEHTNCAHPSKLQRAYRDAWLAYARCGDETGFKYAASMADQIHDPVEAYVTVRLAQRSGAGSFSEELAAVMTRLPPAKVEEAERRFENWEPTADQCNPIFHTEARRRLQRRGSLRGLLRVSTRATHLSARAPPGVARRRKTNPS